MQSSAQTMRSCPRNARSYAWQEGDTLLSVAAANGINPGALASTNTDINFQHIQPGTLICVPLGNVSQQPDAPVLDGTGNDNNIVVPDAPVLDGTGNDNNTVTPQRPVLDGTGSDNNTVTPQRPGTSVPVQPGLSCPIGYAPYTVRRGQTYADLLVDLNVSYNALRTTNPSLNPAALIAGTRFCAPPAGARQACARRTDRLREGENLAAAALRLGTTPGRLLMLNPCLLPTDFTEGALICVP